MRILFTSYKGGMGKSSIAFNCAAYINSIYITNDIIAINDEAVVQIESKKRRIPAHYCTETDIIFDIGSMSTQIDPRVSHALTLSDAVAIPTSGRRS